jgi:uncharacterized protein YecT (DUF1311 family)
MRTISKISWMTGMVAVAMHAQADDPSGGYFNHIPVECSGNSQVEINNCWARVLRSSDHDLNALYEKLMGAADREEQGNLQRMQRAWIVLRDSQCDLYVGYHQGAANLSAWDTYCRAAMTAIRVVELRQLGTGILGKQQ